MALNTTASRVCVHLFFAALKDKNGRLQ